MTGYVIKAPGGGQFDPDGRANVPDVDAHNAAIEAAELARWRDKPATQFAYVAPSDRPGIVATWRGAELGRIVRQSSSRNPLTGYRVTHLRVRGNNGAAYHGRFGSDWSQAVMLHRCKGRRE